MIKQQKVTNYLAFLNKFSAEQIEKIDQFAVAHKSFLDQPPPSRISIFEDAVILSECLKRREKLQREGSAALLELCEMVGDLLGGSKKTIRPNLLEDVPLDSGAGHGAHRSRQAICLLEKR